MGGWFDFAVLFVISIATIGFLFLSLSYYYRNYWSYEDIDAVSIVHKCPLPKDGSEIVLLTHGYTRFVIDGSLNEGPLLVLIHGFSGCANSLDYVARELATTQVIN